MQIVIDISDKMYQAVKDGTWCGSELWYNALNNGTPLPKGHGRLIDESTITSVLFMGDGDVDCDAPTVIEANKEEQE